MKQTNNPNKEQKLCEAEVRKNIVLVETGGTLTLPLATLNRNCEFKKVWEKTYDKWHPDLEKKAKKREYYQKNKDKLKAYREKNKDKLKAYYEKNKDKIAESNKAYYEKNKDKLKAYYEKNKDKIAESKKAYYEKNKDKLKAYYEKRKKNSERNCERKWL